MKKNFLLPLFIFFLACHSDKSSGRISKQEDDKHPNIIFIMADDLAMQAISSYNGIYKEVAPTPHIDRLAQEGMQFQNVLSTNAICGPSRASILTGNYSHVHRYYKNEKGGKFNADLWTFPQEFKQNGYQTALFGKWHLGSEPKGFDVYKYHNAHNQQGKYNNPVYNENGKNVTEKGYATDITTRFAIDWLKKERTSEKPFLMLLQYKAPHRPWQPPQKYLHLWDSIEMPYPASFNDDYKGRELTAGNTEMTMDYLSRRDMKLKRPDSLKKPRDKVRWDFYGAKKGEIVQPEGLSVEEGRKWRYQNFIKDYLACVKAVDDNLKLLFDYLDQTGLADNTIIVMTSDQGFFLGEHGFFDKRFIYEQPIHMPFIIKYPKHVKPHTINNRIISNIDIAPTLLDLAHIQTTQKMQGKSFKKLLFNPDDKSWNDTFYYHYYEFPYWHHVEPHYGIRTQDYTLAHFYYDIDVWELYDLKKDSLQIHNVYNDPAYKDVVIELKKQLKEIMKYYGDDKSLDEFRKITDTDFGRLSDNKNQISVEEVINETHKK